MSKKIDPPRDDSWLPAGSYTRETLPPPPKEVRELLADIGYYELKKALEREPQDEKNKIKILSRQRKSVKIISRVSK